MAAPTLSSATILNTGSGKSLQLVFSESVNAVAGKDAVVSATAVIGSLVGRKCHTRGKAPASGNGTSTHVYSLVGTPVYGSETTAPTIALPSGFVTAVSGGAGSTAVSGGSVTNNSTAVCLPMVGLWERWWQFITASSWTFDVMAIGILGGTFGLSQVSVDVTDGTTTKTGTATLLSTGYDGWQCFRVTVTALNALTNGPVTVTAKATSSAGQGTRSATARTYYLNIGSTLAKGNVYWDPVNGDNGNDGLTASTPRLTGWACADAGISEGWDFITIKGVNTTADYNPRTGYYGVNRPATLFTFESNDGNRAHMRIVYAPEEGAIEPRFNANRLFQHCTIDVSAGGVDANSLVALGVIYESGLYDCLVEFGPGGNRSAYKTGSAQWSGAGFVQDTDMIGSVSGPCNSAMVRNCTVDGASDDITTGCVTGVLGNIRVTNRCIGRQVATVACSVAGTNTIHYGGNQDSPYGDITLTDANGTLVIPTAWFPVTAISTGSKTFTFGGDVRNRWASGDTIRIDLSSTAGLNGSYTVNGTPALVSGDTVVTVTEAISSATIGGAYGVTPPSHVASKINARTGWTCTVTVDTIPAGHMPPTQKTITSTARPWNLLVGGHSDLIQDFGGTTYSNKIHIGYSDLPWEERDAVATAPWGVQNDEQGLWMDHSGPPVHDGCAYIDLHMPIKVARSAIHGTWTNSLMMFITFADENLNPVNRSDAPLDLSGLYILHSVFASMGVEESLSPAWNKNELYLEDIHFAGTGSDYGAGDVEGTLTTGAMTGELTDATLPGAITLASGVPLAGGQLVGRVSGISGFPDVRGTARGSSSAVGAFAAATETITGGTSGSPVAGFF